MSSYSTYSYIYMIYVCICILCLTILHFPRFLQVLISAIINPRRDITTEHLYTYSYMNSLQITSSAVLRSLLLNTLKLNPWVQLPAVLPRPPSPIPRILPDKEYLRPNTIVNSCKVPYIPQEMFYRALGEPSKKSLYS